jgi:hypothetical protein
MREPRQRQEDPTSDTTYIVECSVCHRPWEVLAPMYPSLNTVLLVPAHDALRPAGDPSDARCSGTQVSGLGMGERWEWAHNWRIRFVGSQVPEILDGSTEVHAVHA